jgi:hypothetical protein
MSRVQAYDNFLYEPVATIANCPENGEIVFLPILCHEFSHRRKTFLGNIKMVSHEQGCFLDRIRMEDRVLAGFVRYLLGLAETDVADLNTPDVMIL